MSKKFKFLIGSIIVLVIIGFIIGIRSLYRFYIIENIYNAVKEYVDIDNYYLKTTIKHKEETAIIETYYKDGTGRLVSENSIYTWVRGEEAYMIDETNQKIYNLETQNSSILVSNEMFASLYPFYSKPLIERFIFAGNMQNKIKNVKLEDKKCIMIEVKEDNVIKTIWVTKNKSEIIKARVEFSNSDIYDYEYELKFNTIKLKDVEKPDIANYTVINDISDYDNN